MTQKNIDACLYIVFRNTAKLYCQNYIVVVASLLTLNMPTLNSNALNMFALMVQIKSRSPFLETVLRAIVYDCKSICFQKLADCFVKNASYDVDRSIKHSI